MWPQWAEKWARDTVRTWWPVDLDALVWQLSIDLHKNREYSNKWTANLTAYCEKNISLLLVVVRNAASGTWAHVISYVIVVCTCPMLALTTDSRLTEVSFYVGKWHITSAYMQGQTTGLLSEPERQSCNICQRMSNFVSCQFIFIRMAYITDKLQLTPNNSNSNRFSLDFSHTFTAVCIYCNSTLDNSNYPLTRSSFCFPSDHFYITLPSITRTTFESP